MPKDDVHSILTAAQAFLRQQHELSGNCIYRSSAPRMYAEPACAQADVASVHGEFMNEAAARAITAPVGETREAAMPRKRTNEATSSPCAQMWERAGTLEELNGYIRTCAECPLASTRTNFVFGVGPSDAKAMVIGEAPGADEDAQGEPFVGRAGQLLNKILEAVDFKRSDVFIANILKCRPPNNRRPLPTEVEHCEPYLWKQIELIKPKIILCLGLTAAQTLLKSTASLGTLRGSTQQYRGIPLVVTYHPAALLRNPNWKRPTWEDVKKFRSMYDNLI